MIEKMKLDVMAIKTKNEMLLNINRITAKMDSILVTRIITHSPMVDRLIDTLSLRQR